MNSLYLPLGRSPCEDYTAIKSAIQRELQDSLALKIFSGDFHEGDVIRVDREEGCLAVFTAARGEVVEA